MNVFETVVRKAGLAAMLMVGVTLAGSMDVYAAPLALSKVPLYTNESVEPNFVLTFDDSGSMARAFVPDAFSDDSTLFPGYPHALSAGKKVPIDTRCWWVTGNWSLSPEVNKIYYNPDIKYLPPKLADGTSMPNRAFGAAVPQDGIAYQLGTSTATRNLVTDYRINWEYNANPDGYPSTIVRASGSNTQPSTTNGSNCETAATMYRNFPFADARAFYYRFTGNDSVIPPACAAVAVDSRRFNNACYVAVDVNADTAAQKANFANWYSYYRTRSLLARTSLSRVFDTQQNLRVAWQGLTADTLNNNDVIETISGGSAQRTSLFNFVLTSPVSGTTHNRAATQRVGNYFGGTNNQNSDLNNTNPYYDATANRELSCRQNFHLLVTDGGWNGNAGVAGDYDHTSTELPDGKSYSVSAAVSKIYSNEDARNSDGLADNAFYFWSKDLRPNLDNNVPASYEDLTVGVIPGEVSTPLAADELPSSRPEVYYNPVNDPATWQHVVQYIVGFGIGGDIPFPSGYDALRAGTYAGGWPYWVSVSDINGAKVDDTWHAAINSRGEFFSVNDPQELIDSLGKVFLSIGKRTGSNTPLSLSSGLLTTNTLGYQTSFDTSDWSGSVLASKFATNPPVPQWDASCILTGGSCVSVPALGSLPGRSPASRLIATRNDSTGLGVPFQLSSLSTLQQAALAKDPANGAVDGLGTRRIAYVRGDRTFESKNGGTFRNRRSLMGAVINSAALLPRDKDFYRDDTSFEAGSSERDHPYSVFAATMKDYDTVFVGANDGMLHAFDSSSYVDGVTGGGTERWAYIPGKVVANLNKLTSQAGLQYQSYVDSTPQTRDVFINNQWRRVLVGGLRLGGQGVYALDITNQAATSESDVAGKLLWEFNDKSAGGLNLGYTYGTPYITRLANGKWVALVPGGYNSEESDGAVGTGLASLFVLDMANGSVIKEFQLPLGSRGLSSVNAGDYRVDGVGHDRDVTDVAFAGDINGNIWRFNFQGATVASWTFDKFFTAEAGQAITVLPRLVRTSYEDVPGVGGVKRKFVVTFGTGKYIENSDRAVGTQQAYYGIYDQGPGAATVTQAQLHKQTLTESTSVIAGVTRTIRKLTSTQVPGAKKGWYFNFVSPGERNIAAASVRNISGTLIFTTLVPLSTNPCQPAADSWLIFADATTGGVPGTGAAGADTNNDGVADTTTAGLLSPTFDTNGSGEIDSADDKDVVGLKLDGYAAGVTPATEVGGGSGQILLPGGQRIIIPDYSWRRRSWREIVNEAPAPGP